MAKKNKEEKVEEKVINENIITQSIDQVMDERFARYAKYIIQQRALPDARDGLKPVQRRILYSMYELNLTHDKPFKKSARVVGDVIGKYHPHGDSSIYEAMVRMSQDWKMNIPLVEMHGNVGSIDDDPAAAMRYTEARLSKITSFMLDDLKKNAVNFAPNFDDSEKEPVVLPSLIPNLLVNGTRGIAAGYATDMPPHNLGEVIDATIAKIKNPAITLNQLRKYIQGPDFPTGGIIFGGDGIIKAFERGNARIILVSKKHIINNENDEFKYIEVSEIPYGVIKSKLVYEIDSIIQNQSIDGLLEVKDQSDRNGISIMIKLDKNASEDTIWKFLLSKTELQVYYSYNNVAIVNNTPKLLNLNQLLSEFINHITEVKYKTIKFDLEKFYNRLEIVEGFIKVAELLDKVIKVIRQAENSRQGVIDALISNFDFTQNQAIAIADMRLYRLSQTDRELYIKERDDLKSKINFLNNLIQNKDEFNKWLIEILKNIKKEFAEPRKTQIEQKEFTTSYNEIDLIKEEEIYIGVTNDGYIKKLSKKTFKANEIQTYKLKPNDYLLSLLKVKSTTNILIFTDLGRYALIPAYKIPESKWKDLGSHITEFVDYKSEESIVSVIAVDDFDINAYIIIATRSGLVKRIDIEDLLTSRYNSFLIAIKIKEGDIVVNAVVSNGKQDVVFVTKNGLGAKYPETEIPIYGTRTQGVKAFNINEKDSLTSFCCINENEELLMFTKDYFGKRIKYSDISYTNKKNVGKQLFLQKNTSPYIPDNIAPVLKTDKFLLKHNEILEQKLVTEIPLSNSNEGFRKLKETKIEGVTILSSQIVSSNNKIFVSINKEKEDITNDLNNEFEQKAEKKLIELSDSIDDIDELLKKINENIKKNNI
ncbi:DNA topoisomerase IV subunit A [Mycoplasma elephantis]|uniref:DNA topoisomerase IV subunit A n=1 Tax=Mycoplasma elephantis TaxID=114882 RepID=UPI000481D43D|nr:DNA topoisomerase IV subunit A [Mycoplasma elephantis]